jgi:hypothetical protein
MMNAGLRVVNFFIEITLWLFLVIVFGNFVHAQQPQTTFTTPQEIKLVNSKWTQGVGPGYWVYQTTAGLGITVSPGTVNSCYGTYTTFAGGIYTLTNNATNYVYLDMDNSCTVTVNTTGPTARDVLIEVLTTVSGAVTVAKDGRTWNTTATQIGGVNAQSGTSYTVVGKDFGKDVTFSNAGTVTVTLPTTLGNRFAFATQNLGVGNVNFTPSSGTINGSATLAVTTGTGGWLFFDGTNWKAVIGGGTGGGSTNTVHVCTVALGGENSTQPTLQTTDGPHGVCPNIFGADETVTAVAVCVDAGVTTFRPALTLGAVGSILSGAITPSGTCAAHNWTAGTVMGSPIIHSFSANGATCSSTPCTADVLLPSVDGLTRYAEVTITVTGPGGTGGTPINVGGAANHEMLVNVGGLVAGVANSTAGLPVVSNGPTSTPSQQQLPNSGLVNASTTVDGNTCTLGSTCVSNPNPTHLINCPDSSGSGTAQVCNTSPTFTPVGGTGGPDSCINYTTTTTNSGTGLTVNVNSLGVKSFAIAGASGWTTVLTAGVIPANKPLIACYDGTNWDVQQTGTAASGGSGLPTSFSCTASNSAACTFTSCITSTYNHYKFTFIDVVPVSVSGSAWLFGKCRMMVDRLGNRPTTPRLSIIGTQEGRVFLALP